MRQLRLLVGCLQSTTEKKERGRVGNAALLARHVIVGDLFELQNPKAYTLNPLLTRHVIVGASFECFVNQGLCDSRGILILHAQIANLS